MGRGYRVYDGHCQIRNRGGGNVPIVIEYCVNDDPTPKVNGGAYATHFPERDTSPLL